MSMKNMKTNRKNPGFTMIEMMIVLAIIGIIIAIAIPSLRAAKMNAEKTACKASLKGVETALEFFYNENERYVTDQETIEELVKRGKLKKGQLKDPWRNIWDYKAVDSASGAKAQRYYLRSIGPDAKRDTEDDINSDNYPWPVTDEDEDEKKERELGI